MDVDSKGVGAELLEHELGTARSTHVGWFEPPDPVGMQGKHFVYTVNQQLDELLLLEGVR